MYECKLNVLTLLYRVTTPLFDLSCVQLNESTRRQLMQGSQHLRHLCMALEALIKHAGVSRDQVVSQEGMDELETKYSVCLLVSQYLDVVLWFFNAGLLPEVREAANVEVRHDASRIVCLKLTRALSQNLELTNNPYPVQLMVSLYRDKRRKMQTALNKFSGHISTPALLIDSLCSELGEVLVVRPIIPEILHCTSVNS